MPSPKPASCIAVEDEYDVQHRSSASSSPSSSTASSPSSPSSTASSPAAKSPPSPEDHGRRDSMKHRWEDILSSGSHPTLTMTRRSSLHQISNELGQRDEVNARIELMKQAAERTRAQESEQQRRLSWARNMIVQNPELCAEVCRAVLSAS